MDRVKQMRICLKKAGINHNHLSDEQVINMMEHAKYVAKAFKPENEEGIEDESTG